MHDPIVEAANLLHAWKEERVKDLMMMIMIWGIKRVQLGQLFCHGKMSANGETHSEIERYGNRLSSLPSNNTTPLPTPFNRPTTTPSTHPPLLPQPTLPTPSTNPAQFPQLTPLPTPSDNPPLNQPTPTINPPPPPQSTHHTRNPPSLPQPTRPHSFQRRKGAWARKRK